MQKCYISVDVEGSVGFELPPVSNMVSLGACVIGKPDQRFYIEFKLLNDNWDPEAEKIHRLTRAYLRRNGEYMIPAMTAFRNWTLGASGGADPVFCATPIAYDWAYVDWCFRWCGIQNPYVETLDGRQLYRMIKGLPDSVKVERKSIWSEFPTQLEHTHHALDDALEQEEVFRQMLHVAGLL